VAVSIRRRVLLTVVFTVFLDLVGFGIVIPLLPLYVTEMHASKLIVGVILSCFSLAQLIATPLLGRLSDRYGRRRIILVSLAGNALSMLIFALATRLSLLWLLFVSRIIAGATAGNLSACQAAVADVTSREERAGAMGQIGAGIGLGLVVGPFLGGQLSRFAPWAPPAAAAAMAMLDLLLTAVLMPETRPAGAARASEAVRAPERGPAPPGDGDPAGPPPQAVHVPPSQVPPSLWAVLQERRMASVLVLYFLTFMAISNLQAALALLAKERLDWGGTEIGHAFGLFGLCGLVIQGFLMRRLAKLAGEVLLIIAGAALNLGGMLCISFARTPATLISGFLLIGIGFAITNPSLTSLASRLARDEQQGAVLGFAQSAGGLARTIGPTWSTLLFTKLGGAAPFLSGAVAALLSLLFGLWLRIGAGARPAEAEGRAPP
jgi:MFS family permease